MEVIWAFFPLIKNDTELLRLLVSPNKYDNGPFILTTTHLKKAQNTTTAHSYRVKNGWAVVRIWKILLGHRGL